jgi:single-strand DNA-binding protein
MSLNRVTLIGNVGRDPDVRFMPDGSRVVSFSLATGESWKDKVTGERRERTEWHKIVAFSDRLAELCEKFIKKGSKLYVDGQIQSRKWTDATGMERYTTEIVISRFKGDILLMDPKKSDQGDISSVATHEVSDDIDHIDERPVDIPLDDDVPF